MGLRITVDIGGTFTDIVASDATGRLLVGKAPTTPDRAFDGVHAALEVIAPQVGTDVRGLLGGTDLFVYSTTRATNAIIERKTARTALLVTAGFPDVLLMREGGKASAFDFDVPYPEPYVPRRLTFELGERVDADGGVVTPLDEDATRALLRRLPALGVEAVAVALLWSVLNPAHERRVADLLREELPAMPFTLSHDINPVIREYRRTSAAAIDASLKPLMAAHMRAMAEDLAAHGFEGELLGATLFGGVMHMDDLIGRPIYSAGSGPAMAPVAGKVYGELDLGARDIVVGDMGGTSFDVSLVRDGAVNYTRETWLGDRFTGHLLGTSSVDVHSIGAGGGSIAWIDPGGLLRVGPQSAGAMPGPACYGRGGDRPTVTDAAVVLGYLDPEHFLAGRMALDADAANRVISDLGDRLGLGVQDAAGAVLEVANEHMVAAIREITVNQGVDPRDCLFVAGGGAAGLSVSRIVRELGCGRVLVPRAAGTLSAVGAQFSNVVAEFATACATNTADFDYDAVASALGHLADRAATFAAGLARRGLHETTVEYYVEARYAYQVWDLEVRCPGDSITGPADVAALSSAFDHAHEQIFSVAEPGQTVELLSWKARVIADLGASERLRRGPVTEPGPGADAPVVRKAFFRGHGWLDTSFLVGAGLSPGSSVSGPAVISEPTSTLVVYPGDRAVVTGQNNYLLEVGA